MEEIEQVVQAIVDGCQKSNTKCTPILAAFIARTILESDNNAFSLDTNLTDTAINGIVNSSIERLCERDSPSLETIRMQVSFDSRHLEQETKKQELAEEISLRKKNGVKTIINWKSRDAGDFEALTSLYRDIFLFLTKDLEGKEYVDPKIKRQVEREVAAGVESVFPRIGLKSFLNLSLEEKKTQMEELSSIVLGIRLFNKEAAKLKGGGTNNNTTNNNSATSQSGLEDVEVIAMQKVSRLNEMLTSSLQEVDEICVMYQEALVYTSLNTPPEITPFMISRWKEELINRRQFICYCQSLYEDVSLFGRKIAAQREEFLGCLDDLSSLVGSRSSVPKEHVYPKFDKIAKLWLLLNESLELVNSREETFRDLLVYRTSFTESLTFNSMIVKKARESKNTSVDQEVDSARAAIAVSKSGEEKKDDYAESKAEAKVGGESKGEDKDEKESKATKADMMPAGMRPVCLSVESTPEFMQLPLEYQGFCPWTISQRAGLLLPGKPALGVIQYNGKYYVFAHEVALNVFLSDPEKFKNGLKNVAMKNPELIHLLRLTEEFPNAAISKIMGNMGQINNRGNSALSNTGELDQSRVGGTTPLTRDGIPIGFSAPAEKKDQSTETPTHFIEKNIDPNYSWNEWSLRRRALQIANLRKCKTTSQQTDLSQMRRDIDTQVYLKREKDTQTRTSTGTSAPREVTYIRGLRGDTKNMIRDGEVGITSLKIETGASVDKGQNNK